MIPLEGAVKQDTVQTQLSEVLGKITLRIINLGTMESRTKYFFRRLIFDCRA